MTTRPQSVTSRRSILRAAAGAGSALAVAPVIAGIATEASVAASANAPEAFAAVAGSKRFRRCRRLGGKIVRRRGKRICLPRRKKKASTTPPVTKAPAPPSSPKPTPAAKPTTAPKPTKPTPTPTTPPVPTPLASTAMLPAGDRHLVSRFSYGVDRAQADQVIAAGGAAAWFEAQLVAPGTSDPATDDLIDWYPSLSRAPLDLWQRQVAQVEFGAQVMDDYQRFVLIRRLRSSRPLLDVMTEFWENHFNVPVDSDRVFPYRVSYGAALRDHALGRFEDLLLTAITHPAMLIYLDGAISTKTRPNENLGRELLELHTVGVGQYDENDVKASARVLTGYRVDIARTWAASYQPTDHYVGPVTVMSFSDPNPAADGRPVAAAYLRYLAHHPATARRIARKLATKFVSDTPSVALVDSLAQVYLDHDTDLAPVLRALAASQEFTDSVGAKIRDPGEDVVATYKALGVTVAPPMAGRPAVSAERTILSQTNNLGATPHNWPRPDGAPIDNDSWCSTARVLASLDMHYKMSQRSVPSQGVTYRMPVEWLPSPAVTFADLVEHLSRQILHATAPPELHVAAGLAVRANPTDVITASHAIVKSQFSALLATILDSPLHLKR